jgi:hypothetical protein
MKMKKQTHRSRVVFMGLLLAGMMSSMAMGVDVPSQGENDVFVSYEVAQRLVFGAICCATVGMTVDVILQPSHEVTTAFQVKTNAALYAVTAAFGTFLVGGDGYDLIANDNFKIRSTAPGIGVGIASWTTPSGTMDILIGEDGLTNGEQLLVDYQLTIDFSVPTGTASTTVIYTATIAL